MDILSLTSTEAVRAILGIDTHDYSETKFTELDLDSDLEVHLATWFPDWSGLLADNTADADVERQKLALKIYSKYYCARVLFTSAPMAFLKERSDGEVEANRFDDSALENLRLELDTQLSKRMEDVLDIATEFTPDTTSATGKYTQFSRVANSRNVLTDYTE